MKKYKDNRDKELDEYVESEYKRQIEEEKDHKEKPLDVFKAIFEKDPEEQEFDAYYRENYKEEYEADLKEDRRIKIIAASVVISVFIVFGVGISIITEIFKSDLLKVTKPMLENYYIENYNGEEKIDDISYLQKYNSETKKYEDTNIVLATLSNNSHLMCIDNSNIGSDINVSKVYDEYKNDLRNFLAGTEIVYNNPTLSYTDYYNEYSIYYDYIKVLPDFKKYEDLLISRKVTLTDVLIYTNFIDTNEVKKYLLNFTENSIIYAIKQEAGNPVLLSVITRDNIIELPITTSLIDSDLPIVNYEFSTDYCDVSSVDFVKINSKVINPDDDIDYNNGFKMILDYIRVKKDVPEKPKYFLIKVTDNYLSDDSMVLLDIKKSNKRKFLSYQENYPNVAYISFNDSMYIMGTLEKNKEIGFANKHN